MFKDIILAITPSEICECAADKAFAFAQRFESKLYLVHICGIEHGWGSMEHLEASGETARIKDKIMAYYGDKLEGIKDYEVIVRAGIPHNEILRLVRQKNADLVVMGPHTKKYVEERSRMWGMAGSTLERVSQRCPCPVMIVTRQAPYGEQVFNKVLVATDFSDPAECAVNYGAQMARHYKSELVVFHAMDQEELPQEEVEQRVEAAKNRMSVEYGPRLAGISASSFECWEGKASTEILKTARIHKADLIIMAHHTREVDPEKAVLGSTVVQVALNSSAPTMSVNKHFDLRCGLMYDQTGEATEVGSAAAPAES